MRAGWYGRRGKRISDVALATTLLALSALPMACVAVLVACSLGRPVLFRQDRAGRRGRVFTLLKFRTMRTGMEGESDEARLTGFGRSLRSTSLDELPQLWNVIRGDMSMVGPRPLPPRYVGRYDSEQARRLLVLPGLTGLAQVEGRNGLTWQERFARDTWYVDHVSPWLDVSILLRTVGVVLSGRGVAAAGHATMPEFLGSTQHADDSLWTPERTHS